MPNEAYWTSIDLRSVAAAIAIIGGVAFPFVRDIYKEWRAGRRGGLESAASIAESAAARQERINREQYDRIVSERAYHADLAQRNAAALLMAQADAGDRRREARAMEDWAHYMRHQANNANGRFLNLIELADRFLAGNMTQPGFQQIVATLKASPPDMQPDVPKLDAVTSQRPPE